jgi:hypothetical protein
LPVNSIQHTVVSVVQTTDAVDRRVQTAGYRQQCVDFRQEGTDIRHHATYSIRQPVPTRVQTSYIKQHPAASRQQQKVRRGPLDVSKKKM